MGPWESIAAHDQKRRYGAAGYFTIDEKPKREPGANLKRLANLRENPFAALVVDRYDEDWTRLAWLMLQGRAEILHAGPEHDRARTTLRARYRQLATMRIDHLPVVAIRIDHATSWGRLNADGAAVRVRNATAAPPR